MNGVSVVEGLSRTGCRDYGGLFCYNKTMLPVCPKDKKVSYETDENAWLSAFEVWKKYDHEQRPYLCVHCGYYHLTTGIKTIPNWLIQKMGIGLNKIKNLRGY